MRKKRKASGKRLARNHTEAEQAQLQAYRERSKKLSPKCRQESNGVVFEAQDELGYAAMMEAVGTADVDLTNLLLSQATRVLPYEEGTMGVKSNGTLAMLHGIAPRDELEGMLAAQMVGVLGHRSL